MESEVHALQIAMTEITANLKNFGNKLEEHIANQKETDKKVDDNFSKIFTKIDHLGDTFQTRLGDKADQKEVMNTLSEMETRYVSKEAFGPVQKIVYGLAGGILIAFLGAIVALLFQ